jgi:hypothetical protein
MYIHSTQKNYVSPGLCRQLLELGMPEKTCFFWILSGEQGELGSDLFDEDNYYAHTRQLLEGLKLAETLPSYTIGDMMDLLPNFCIEKLNTQYQVFIEDKFTIEPVSSPRFADALAHAVIAGLKSNVLSVPSPSKTNS